MFEEPKQEMYGAETLYREIGYYMFNKQKFKRSIPHFDKAYEVTPKDFRTLLGRSFARAKCIYFKCALDDINAALKYFPGDLRAEQQKAYYTFLKTDFEDAFILNQRGILKRRKPDMFFLGTMQCAEEVERTIGKRGGHALRDHYNMIRTIAWKKALDLRKGPQWKPRFKKRKRKPKKADNTPALYTNFMKKMSHSSELSILESLAEDKSQEYATQITKMKTNYHPLQKRTTNIVNVMSEKYLDKMCYDKLFLKDLKSDPRILCPNKAGAIQIKVHARKGLNDVKSRQKILRVRQPYYSIKYNEVESKGALLQRQIAELGKLQEVSCHDVEVFLKNLREAKQYSETNKCLTIANNMKSYIDKKPLKILPDKEIYLRQLYEIIGAVHLDCYRIVEGMNEYEKEKRINFLFGLPISRAPSSDSVIRENKKEFEDIKKKILDTECRMAKATTPLETVWLFYDLARFNIQLKKWDLGRFYARKSLIMARILQNPIWETNVQLLITKSLVLQRNRNEAKNELKRTRTCALQLKHADVIMFIDRSLPIIEQLDFEDISLETIIKQREKQIIRTILRDSLQIEMNHLFEQIDAIPGARRMPIMPGVNLETKPPSRKTSAVKPSIHPRSAIEVEFQVQLKKKGLELLDPD